jgi:hypothetical protein
MATIVNPLSIYKSSFNKLKSKVYKKPIIGFDSEDDSKGTPTLFAFYGDFKKAGKNSYWTKHWEESLDFILEDVTEPSIFVAHNLEYDIANLFKGQDYVMIEEMVYSSGLLKVTIYGVQHIFINSSSFFKGSLKKMGDLVGVKKKDGHALDTDYVCVDAQIVYKFMKDFQDIAVDEFDINLGITLGQMSMNTYRRHYMQKDTQVTYNSPLCLDSYYGGRVEIFYRGTIENVNVIDINSSYPYNMREFAYPDPNSMEPSKIGTHEYGIGVFTVLVPPMMAPPLPYRGESGRLYFPIGEFTGCWTYTEVRYAQGLGVKIVKEHVGEGTNIGVFPFREFMDDNYEKRQVAKAAGNEVYDLIQKLKMNNLYGKWCQRNAGNLLTRDKIPFWKIEKFINHPDFKTSKIGPFYSYKIPKIEPPKTACFIWGTYVTSYARIHLHKGIQKVVDKGYTPIYCDTDSIMYSTPKKTDKPPLKISKKLGDWDIEKFDLGVFRVPKGYLLCNKKGKNYEIEKVACKGVPTHLAYDFILKGLAMVQKPMRFKEALITLNSKAHAGDEEFLKDVGVNVWKDIEKQMRSLDIKRKGGAGPTKALDASEIPAIELQTKVENANIEEETLKKYPIKKKQTKANKFKNTIIPKDWFLDLADKKEIISLNSSQKVKVLNPNQCEGMVEGEVWFKGTIIGSYFSNQEISHYKIFIKNFKGKKRGVSFLGGLKKSFIHIFTGPINLNNKNIEIILLKKYIDGEPFKIKVNISNSKLKGFDFEEEKESEEKISEEEINKLKNLNWSIKI